VETWHYVAIGAVVVIGGVWYVRRRNKAKAAQVGATKKTFADPRYEKSVGERGPNFLMPGYGSQEKLELAIKGDLKSDYNYSDYLADSYFPKKDGKKDSGGKSDAVKGSY
jgi:hypothetical protein